MGLAVSGLTARIVALAVVLLIAGAIAAALRLRDRRITVVTGDEVLTAADLQDAAGLGSRATFVQFSTPMCSGCKPAARVLDQLVAQERGLRRIEIDATVRPDLADRLHVMSTPTVIVLDREGRIVSRLTGVPTPDRARIAAGLSPSSEHSGAAS